MLLKNYSFTFACVLVLAFSCKKQTQDKPVDPFLDSIEYATEEQISVDSVIDDKDYPVYDDLMYNNILIYEANGYREDDFNKHIFSVKDTVMGLFMKANEYRLMKCRIIKVNVYEDDCTGIAMYEPTLNVRDTCLFLFKGLNKLNEKSISTPIVNKYLFAGETYPFTANGVEYSLKATANILYDQGIGNERWQNVNKYNLFLNSAGKKQCILKLANFNDTMVKAQFVGDIDGDGKPDLILSAPQHYEETRVMLYLSSFAIGDEMVKLVSVKNDVFDC